jgi:hypothetical protein
MADPTHPVQLAALPPKPIRLDERRPTPQDCDAYGFCWAGYPWTYNDANEKEGYCNWMLVPADEMWMAHFWLPYRALPVPGSPPGGPLPDPTPAQLAADIRTACDSTWIHQPVVAALLELASIMERQRIISADVRAIATELSRYP